MLTAEDHANALASLLGVAPGAIPDPVVARVAMIHEALRRGLTWRQIGTAMGTMNPKEAKAQAKRLARHASKALLEQAARQLRQDEAA